MQASYAQSVAKAQTPRKYRTLNLSPKCKHRANIARSMCRQNASAVQASYAQSVAKVQAPCNIARSICRQSANTVQYRTFNVPTKCKRCASIARSMCRQNASAVQASYAQSVAKAQTPCKQHPFCRLFCAFPCRICLSIQVLALGVAKTAKFYRFFTAIGFDAAGASPPVLS